MNRGKTSLKQRWMALVTLHLPIALAGCQRVPSFNIAGSFFPDWILCSIGGLLAGLLANALFVRLKLEREIQPPILIYPCIVLSCTITLWLLLFS